MKSDFMILILFSGRPHFVVEPSDVDAVEGNNVYFSCRAMGDPEPEIVWLHNK